MDIPFAGKLNLHTVFGEMEVEHIPFVPSSEIEQVVINVKHVMDSGYTFLFYGQLDARKLLGKMVVIAGQSIKYVPNENPELVFLKDTNAQLFKLSGKKKSAAAAQLLEEHKKELFKAYLRAIGVNQHYYHMKFFEAEIERLRRRAEYLENVKAIIRESQYE